MSSAEPMITFLLLAYKQGHSVAAAIDGAFSQTYSNLEIILSDDSSPDNTLRIMQQKSDEFEGRHLVRTRRTKRNVGLVSHLQEAIKESNGQLIIIAAGDDISLPTRSEEIVRRWISLGRPSAVIYSDFQAMDIDGNLVELAGEKVYPGPFDLCTFGAPGSRTPFGATSAITPDLIDVPSPISASVNYEDRVLPFRALLSGGQISFIDRKLVLYRVEGGLSRELPTDRLDYVRDFARRYHLKTLADARQRLRDSTALQPHNDLLIRNCAKAVNFHRSRLIMSDGRQLARKAIYFARRGATLRPLLRHLINCMIGVILQTRRR